MGRVNTIITLSNLAPHPTQPLLPYIHYELGDLLTRWRGPKVVAPLWAPSGRHATYHAPDSRGRPVWLWALGERLGHSSIPMSSTKFAT